LFSWQYHPEMRYRPYTLYMGLYFLGSLRGKTSVLNIKYLKLRVDYCLHIYSIRSKSKCLIFEDRNGFFAL
jgi:hypothetical protein